MSPKRATIGEQAEARVMPQRKQSFIDAAEQPSKSSRRNIYLPDSLFERTEMHARSKSLSTSALIRLALLEYLERHSG
jgi:hypothetical protein